MIEVLFGESEAGAMRVAKAIISIQGLDFTICVPACKNTGMG